MLNHELLASSSQPFINVTLHFFKPDTPDTNKPIISWRQQQLRRGHSSYSYKRDSGAVVTSFHQLRETIVSTVTMNPHVLGRKNILQHKNCHFPSHPSCAVVPWVTQTGNRNGGILPKLTLKTFCEGQCHGKAMFLSFHPALCNALFTASSPLFHV